MYLVQKDMLDSGYLWQNQIGTGCNQDMGVGT